MPQEFLRDVLRTGDAAATPAAALVGAATLDRRPCGRRHGVPAQSMVEQVDLPGDRFASGGLHQTVAPSPPPPPITAGSGVRRWTPAKAPIVAPDRRLARAAEVVGSRRCRTGRLRTVRTSHSGPPLLGPFGHVRRPLRRPRRHRCPPRRSWCASAALFASRERFCTSPRSILNSRGSAGVQGAVILEAILDATGRVESVRVLGSQPLLEDAAVEGGAAVEVHADRAQWRARARIDDHHGPVLARTMTLGSVHRIHLVSDRLPDGRQRPSGNRRSEAARGGRSILRDAAGRRRRRLSLALEREGQAAHRGTAQVRLREPATTPSPRLPSSARSRPADRVRVRVSATRDRVTPRASSRPSAIHLSLHDRVEPDLRA